MTAVRDIMSMNNMPQMNANEIMQKMKKTQYSTMKITKEELMEALQHYRNLSIIYLDQDENVAIL